MILILIALNVGVLGLQQSSGSFSPKIQQRQVVVDLEVLAETFDSEANTALRGLQALLPGADEPWNTVDLVPRHRYRTFDMNRKFERVVSELKICRLSEMVLLLRMLFEEDRVGQAEPKVRPRKVRVAQLSSSSSAVEDNQRILEEEPKRKGPRPLTAGEIIENWNEVLAPRCMSAWLQSGFTTFQSIETRLEEMVLATPPNLRLEVSAALRESAQRGSIASQLPLIVRADGVFSELSDIDLGSPLLPKTEIIHSPTVLADLLLDTAESSLLYFSASAGLSLQVASALRSSSHPKASNIHVFHCAWSTRWGGSNQPRLSDNNRLDVAVLEPNLRDFRRVIGLPP